MTDYNKYLVKEIRRIGYELVKSAEGLAANGVKGITDVDIYIHIPQPVNGELSRISSTINFIGEGENE